MTDTLIEIILAILALLFYFQVRRLESKVASLDDELEKARVERDRVVAEADPEPWTEVASSYVVTDSDELRYKTAKEIYYNARKRIANNIGFQIVKICQPEESMSDNGHTMYTYRFKIRR